MWTSQQFFRQLLDNLYDGVYFVDRDRVVSYWNRGAERLSGFAASEVVGHSCRDNLLVHVDNQGNQLCFQGCPLAATIEDGQERQAEVFMHHKAGHRVPVQVRVTPIRNPAGAITGAVEIFSDNSAADQARLRAEELEKMAFMDGLTGVANRRFLELTLRSRLEEQRRYGWPVGLLFLDVDHFKSFNDRHGHEVGDQVLKMVATTMTSCSRTFDTVGRWGGEEFIAIIANVDSAQLRTVAERYRQLIEHSGLELAGQLLKVTVSIGAALATGDETSAKLLERADALMYRSKQSGRNRVSVEGMET